MQVDPIKPMLKAPGSELLKLNSDEPLSTLAFKFNLRCYAEEDTSRSLLTSNFASESLTSPSSETFGEDDVPDAPMAGAYTRSLLSST